MTRYIDADRLDEIVQELNEHYEVPITRYEYKRISGVLFEFPTADVVEVVRCKDCVNCAHLVYKYDRNEEWWCGGIEVVPDGFCNYGERREDEN